LDHAHHAGLAEAGDDFVAAEFPQLVGNYGRGAVHVIEQFGIFMDVPAPGLDVRLQIGHPGLAPGFSWMCRGQAWMFDWQPDIQAWRRDIHENPELLYDVHRTAAVVADKLREFGCDE